MEEQQLPDKDAGDSAGANGATGASPEAGGAGGSAADRGPASAVSSSVRVGLTIVDELIRAGVRDAVVCPGSRSAPLALAFAEAARVGRLRLHVRTDERTGSFLALGLAQYTRRPVPIVMTSGSAVAQCLPAMVEATLAHIPLMVLSANRPWSYVGSGANQTIEQRGIFGAHAVAEEGLDTAITSAGGVSDAASRHVRAVVDRLVRAATDPVRGGGVHLDVPFDGALVPESAVDLSMCARDVASAPAGSPPGTPTPHRRYAPVPTAHRLPYGETAVDLNRRALVVAGAVTDRAWARRVLDALADVPAIAEPICPAPHNPVHPAAAALFTRGDVTSPVDQSYSLNTRPEHVIVLGRPTLHRAVSALLADPSIDVTVLTDTETVTDVAHTARTVASTVTVTGEQPQQWLDMCAAISDMGALGVREALAAEPGFTGLHAVAVVADQLSDGDALVLGASSAVRDAARVGLPFDGVHTVSNRGAAGIDGTVSLAIATALAHGSSDPYAPRAPRTLAVMGDLTFLHDATGLVLGPNEPAPENLVIVVLSDDGGAIFESLEPGREGLRNFADGSEAFERVFGTPTGVNIAALCAAAGVRHVAVESAEALAEALEEYEELGVLGAHVRAAEASGEDRGTAASGIVVIEARVDRHGRRALDREIARRCVPDVGGQR